VTLNYPAFQCTFAYYVAVCIFIWLRNYKNPFLYLKFKNILHKFIEFTAKCHPTNINSSSQISEIGSLFLKIRFNLHLFDSILICFLLKILSDPVIANTRVYDKSPPVTKELKHLFELIIREKTALPPSSCSPSSSLA